LLYALAMTRDMESQAALAEFFPDSDPYLQVGGNETVGHGWVAALIRSAGGAP
jgi:CRISPR/Cas system CMR subunit Cmr4 (Cas7 group RAMP superfamily)